MKSLLISGCLLAINLLSGCASTVALNQELAARNVALVKDSVFVPGVSPDNVTLRAIDGQKTKLMSSSNEITSGNHTLEIVCTYYLSSIHQLYGTNIIQVNLESGHTYKLIPVLPVPKTGRCESIIKDQTTSN
jgi:hypothetical protein